MCGGMESSIVLTNKTIVVTGCLQGIGKETLTTFAENGANVIACAYKKDQEFESYCNELAAKYGVQIIPVYFDMSDNDAVKAAAGEIMALKMEINGLVNIAGITRDAYFNRISYTDLLEIFQVNFFAQIIFTQYIVKLMRRSKTKGCSITFTSSLAAIYGGVGRQFGKERVWFG